MSERVYEKACRHPALEDWPDDALSVGAYVLAPVLFAFAWWTLRQAREDKRERLYFLSRDAYPAYRMAQALCEARKIRIDCRYLYASRRAWQLPAQRLPGEAWLERVCRGGIEVSFAVMMERAGLTRAEGEAVAAELHLARRVKEPLSRQEVQGLREPLAQCRMFRELAALHAAERYEGTIGYLRQEGLLEDVPYGVADSGWIGTIQESLGSLLRSAGYRGQPEGYYFGLYNLPRAACRERFHSFYFSPERGAWRKAHFSNSLFECVCMAPHGMTERYAMENGRWEPVLQPISERRREWAQRQSLFWTLYIEEALRDAALAETVQESGGEKGRAATLPEEIRKLPAQRLLSGFMATPSLEESRFYGALPFSDEATEKQLRPLAARLTQRELWEHHLALRFCRMLQLGGRPLRESGWIEGSARLCGGALYRYHQMGIRQYKLLSYLRMQRRFYRERKVG